MNDDIYAEWLVKRQKGIPKAPVYLGLVVLILISLFLITQYSWGIIVLGAVILGFVFLKKYLDVEYEYIFVTNELTVDKIYSQTKRKNVAKIEMSMVEAVEETSESKNKNLLAGKTLVEQDFTSGLKDAKSYTMLYSKSGKRYLMRFEPNDKILRAMWRCSPSKVKIAR